MSCAGKKKEATAEIASLKNMCAGGGGEVKSFMFHMQNFFCRICKVPVGTSISFAANRHLRNFQQLMTYKVCSPSPPFSHPSPPPFLPLIILPSKSRHRSSLHLGEGEEESRKSVKLEATKGVFCMPDNEGNEGGGGGEGGEKTLCHLERKERAKEDEEEGWLVWTQGKRG